jgi:hypothetical protein
MKFSLTILIENFLQFWAEIPGRRRTKMYRNAIMETLKNISGADQHRKVIQNYETSDMVDRLSHAEFYRRMMMDPANRRTIEDDLEFSEGDLQTELSLKNQKKIREYWRKR